MTKYDAGATSKLYDGARCDNAEIADVPKHGNNKIKPPRTRITGGPCESKVDNNERNQDEQGGTQKAVQKAEVFFRDKNVCGYGQKHSSGGAKGLQHNDARTSFEIICDDNSDSKGKSSDKGVHKD